MNRVIAGALCVAHLFLLCACLPSPPFAGAKKIYQEYWNASDERREPSAELLRELTPDQRIELLIYNHGMRHDTSDAFVRFVVRDCEITPEAVLRALRKSTDFSPRFWIVRLMGAMREHHCSIDELTARRSEIESLLAADLDDSNVTYLLDMLNRAIGPREAT